MQQVGSQSLSTDLGWSSGGGGWNLHASTSGSGSWTSIANQDTPQASTWQSVGKSDSASDAGDDSSSMKSGSAISNISNITTQQSQDSTTTSAPGALSINSSSPWNTNTPLTGMESSPWGTSNSPAPSSMGTMGWNNPPNSLSLSTNNQGLQNNLQSGSSISSNTSFNSTIGNSSSGWPSGIASNPSSTTSMPPSMNSGLQSGTITSQWSGSPMLGNIGDFPKSEPNWNNSTSSVIDSALNKENSSDPRIWGLADKITDPQWDGPKSQWANSPIGPGGDQGTGGNTELSFAQATQKGLKPPPVPTTPQTPAINRNEELLRAIENHEGWGSRPIRQDTSWDVDTSPKSHRKFSTDSNAGASNVWNNSNGTAIWEAVRENQNTSWGGAAVSGNSWNGEKDQSGWGAMQKTQQDHNWGAGAVGNGTDSKSIGMWGGPGAAGDAGNKMWAQKPEIGSWESGNGQLRSNMSAWGDEGDTSNWDDQRRAHGAINNPMPGMVPPSPGLPGVLPQGMPGMNNLTGLNTDNPPWTDSQKAAWTQANAASLRSKMDEAWNKPPPKIAGWGDTQEGGRVDDGTSIWAANAPKQLPSQAKAAGWGDNAPQGQWNAAVGAKPKTPGGWDEASWAMAQRAKQVPQKYVGNTGGHHTQMRAKLLQQLMDMGFRKEESQKALITNNMNLELAIHDLKASNVMQRKDVDMDMFQTNGPQSRIAPYKSNLASDDLSDSARSDQVPNFTSAMPNTPFPNAQMPNHPYLPNSTSLPPSSLNPNSSSINSNIQQKLIQKMQVPPVNALGPRGQMPPVGSTSINQVPAQQQRQILDQLRLAIINGFISPQLLNYTLPHNILVLLQQLLQLQSARQNWLIKEKQMLAQGNRGNNRQQLEQMPSIISSINQQITGLQKQLQQAQSKLFSSQKSPNLSQPPNIDPIDAISSELANTNLASQSRLATHWKTAGDTTVTSDISMPSNTSISLPINSGSDSINADKTANSLQGTSSSLNLMGLDHPWSTVSTPSLSSSQNWPSSTTDSVNSSTPGDQKAGTSSSTSSSLSAMPSGFSDVIPEFVPGKPWQGLPKSSIEDDPHVTPGSIQRSLSVNRVHDDSLNNLSGGFKLNNSSWSSAPRPDNSLGLGNLGSRPPPGMAPSQVLGTGPQWQQGNVPFNRQSSWAGSAGSRSAFTQVGSSTWDSQIPISNWILLRNLNSMDSATVRALCQRHGEILQFSYFADGQVALVQYASRDVALNAQRSLNNFPMGSSIIGAESINENDAQRLISQMPPPPPQPSAMTQMNASQWSQAPPTAFQQGTSRSGQIWSQGNSAWTGSPFWDVSSMGDHNSNPLLSNILD